MLRIFLAILLAFATSAQAITTTDIWTPPGGAATTVTGTDKLLIKQGANSRTITRDLLLSGVKPDYRGTYSASVSYPVNAAVLYQGTSYICMSATLAGESPVSQPVKWQVLAQKGDVGPAGPAGSGGSGGGGVTTISSSTPTTFASGTIAGSNGTTIRAATLSDLTTLGAVPNTRTVAGKALSANVTLAASDVGADAAGAATTAVSTHESTYTHGNLPTTGQKAALAGSSGTPGAGNLYVTAADSRLTDARTPVAHNQAWSTITGTPTTLLGYGISDAAASTHLHDSRYPVYHTSSGGAYSIAAGNIYVGPVDPGAIPATDFWVDTSGEVGGVSPTAITCTGTDKVSAYNATTGAFTCTADQTGAGGSGITSLGGLIGSSQTFVNDTNVTMTSTGTTHTLGWTGTLADARIASASTWNAKQAALVSTTNIKSVGGVSLLGAGDLGTLGAGYGGTGLTDFSLSGTAHKVASVGFTNPASVKCVEVDANGNLQIAGSNAACGSGGSGLSTALTAAHIYVGNAGSTATDVAVSGDVTLSDAGAVTVTKVNGVSLAGLTTGILKNTTTTGAPSIAIAADFPTLNQNTTGYATHLAGGNGTTLLGSVPYQSAANTTTLLGPNTTSTKKFLTQTGTGTNGAAPSWGTIAAGDVPTLNQSTTGSAATLTTTRAIYGNNFDGSAALTQIIASTYGGTGNGFTKLSGPTTAEKTFTLPNASATILTDNAVVTGAQGGTGVANTGKTITLGGNLTTSGAYAATLTLTGTTGVTLPTTGTLATLDGTETLTTKTLTAPHLDGAQYAISSSAPSTTGTVTINASTTGHYELSPTGTTTQTIAFSGNPGSAHVRYVTFHVVTAATGVTTLAWPTPGSTFGWIGSTAGATTLTASKNYDYACRVEQTKTWCAIVGEGY